MWRGLWTCLPNNLRPLHRHDANPLPVHAIDERQKLGMVELNPVMTDPRLAELRFFQPLGIKADAGAVPPDDFHSVRSFGPEDT